MCAGLYNKCSCVASDNLNQVFSCLIPLPAININEAYANKSMLISLLFRQPAVVLNCKTDEKLCIFITVVSNVLWYQWHFSMGLVIGLHPPANDPLSPPSSPWIGGIRRYSKAIKGQKKAFCSPKPAYFKYRDLYVNLHSLSLAKSCSWYRALR